MYFEREICIFGASLVYLGPKRVQIRPEQADNGCALHTFLFYASLSEDEDEEEEEEVYLHILRSD